MDTLKTDRFAGWLFELYQSDFEKLAN